VVITVPRGAYVPVFGERETIASPAVLSAAVSDRAVPPAGASDQVPARDRRPTTFGLIAAAVVVSIGLIVSTLALNSSRMTSAQAATGPSLAVLPFEPYSTAAQDVLLAAQITDAVTTELARLKTVSVVSRASASQYGGGEQPMSDIVRALNVRFVMEASAVRSGNEVQVSARLVDGSTDRKIWVGQYSFASQAIPAAARQLAVEAADAALKFANR
jgi:TolB-like protein